MPTEESPVLFMDEECSSGQYMKPDKETPAAAIMCLLLLVGLAGAVLLTWWAIDFHPSNKQLWMVPVGLVMTGTPVMLLFSVFASEAWERLELWLHAPRVSDHASPVLADLVK